MEQIIWSVFGGGIMSIIIMLVGRYIDRSKTTAETNKTETDYAKNLQEIADKAVQEQKDLLREIATERIAAAAEKKSLREEIKKIHAEKKADYEFTVIFTLGPPPAVKHVQVRAIEPIL